MTNPFKNAPPTDRPIPPKDPAERVRFWIDRGNALLLADGRHDLEWIHHNGSYALVPCSEAARQRMIEDRRRSFRALPGGQS